MELRSNQIKLRGASGGRSLSPGPTTPLTRRWKKGLTAPFNNASRRKSKMKRERGGGGEEKKEKEKFQETTTTAKYGKRRNVGFRIEGVDTRMSQDQCGQWPQLQYFNIEYLVGQLWLALSFQSGRSIDAAANANDQSQSHFSFRADTECKPVATGSLPVFLQSNHFLRPTTNNCSLARTISRKNQYHWLNGRKERATTNSKKATPMHTAVRLWECQTQRHSRCQSQSQSQRQCQCQSQYSIPNKAKCQHQSECCTTAGHAEILHQPTHARKITSLPTSFYGHFLILPFFTIIIYWYCGVKYRFCLNFTKCCSAHGDLGALETEMG